MAVIPATEVNPQFVAHNEETTAGRLGIPEVPRASDVRSGYKSPIRSGTGAPCRPNPLKAISTETGAEFDNIRPRQVIGIFIVKPRVEPAEQSHKHAFISDGVQVIELRVRATGNIRWIVDVGTGPKIRCPWLRRRPVGQIRTFRVQPGAARIRRAARGDGQRRVCLEAVHPDIPERIQEKCCAIEYWNRILTANISCPVNPVW